MKIAIVGAGAIGGYIGGRLARAGADVSLLARGPHLAAMQARGLTIETADERFTVPVRATDDPAAIGPVDFVIVTLKAPSFPALAPSLKPLFGTETAVVTAMNGIPFWYFHGDRSRLAGQRLKSIDPEDVLWREIGPQRCIGGVLWLPAAVPEPGVVKRGNGNRLALGEPDGQRSARMLRLSAALQAAGLDAPVAEDIRQSIWVKLWGNIAFSPLTVLTLDTLRDIANDPGASAIAAAIMAETRAVAEALGIAIPVSIEQRIAEAREVGPHKPSMLQDLEAGRPMEIDSIVGVVAELGDRLDIATPTIDLVLALLRRRAAVAGTYPQRA